MDAKRTNKKSSNESVLGESVLDQSVFGGKKKQISTCVRKTF